MKWSQASVALAITVLVVGTVVLSIHAKQDVGIRVLPPTISMKLFPGESGSYELKVHNGLGREVTARLRIDISQLPSGGSALFVYVEFPSSVLLKQGNNRVPVLVRVADQAPPGPYVLSNSVSL